MIGSGVYFYVGDGLTMDIIQAVEMVKFLHKNLIFVVFLWFLDNFSIVLFSLMDLRHLFLFVDFHSLVQS